MKEERELIMNGQRNRGCCLVQKQPISVCHVHSQAASAARRRDDNHGKQQLLLSRLHSHMLMAHSQLPEQQAVSAAGHGDSSHGKHWPLLPALHLHVLPPCAIICKSLCSTRLT